MYGVRGSDPDLLTPYSSSEEEGSFGNAKAKLTPEHVGGSNEGPRRFATIDGTGRRVEADFPDDASVSDGDEAPRRDRALPDEASLRERTVPRAQAYGALGGSLVAAAGVGVAAGVLIGIGKGAVIGAAVGSIIPGAGTVVGAVVGAVVAGVAGGLAASGVGALIGRLAAGGGDRDRAEKLILGLYDKGQITADGAKRLRGLSNSEVSDLVSISASKTGIKTKDRRDAIRREVLVTAARQGPDAAKQRKAALLQMKPPDRAATTMQVGPHTTFSEILKQRAEVDSGALKRAIDNEVGRPGAGDEIFKQLGLGSKVARSDFGFIKTQVDLQAKLNRAAPLRGHLSDLAALVLKYTRSMDDAPEGSTARENISKDLFRPANSLAVRTALEKLEEADDVAGAKLSHEEAVSALKTIWQATPTMPVEKFTALMGNEAVSDAVGYFTGENAVGQKVKVVPLDSERASPENTKAGARRLKDAIEKTLTPDEKEALRERAAYLRDMAALSLDKVGLINDNEDEAGIQKELWIKSIAVSWSPFSGHAGPDVIWHSGLSTKDASIQARDFITACAVHYDTIFGED